MTVIEALTGPFDPPPYPYDRLNRLKPRCEAFDGGLVDLSIGTPFDAPPASVVDALASSNAERGYPPSAGTVEYRTAAAGERDALCHAHHPVTAHAGTTHIRRIATVDSREDPLLSGAGA